MRIYGSIQISFWENSEIQSLSDQSKLLAIYLLTGPHSNMLGCFRLPNGYIVEDLKWETETTQKSFQQLAEIDFLTRDDDTAWVVIHQFLKWNPIQNPRQGMGIQKLFEAVPTHSRVWKPLANGLLTHAKYLDKGFHDRVKIKINPFETLCKPFRDPFETLSENVLTDQDKDQEQDQKKIYMSGKPDVVIHSDKKDLNIFRKEAIEVLDFLNQKAGRAYRPCDANLKLIIARLRTGATVMDCRQVIAKKTREWKGDAKMSEYLRPATLFNAIKFEQYLGELVLTEEVSS